MEGFRQKLNELTKIANEVGFKQYTKDKEWYHDSKLKLYYNSCKDQMYVAESLKEAIEMYLDWYRRDRNIEYFEEHKVEEEKQSIRSTNAIYEFTPKKGALSYDINLNWDLYRG